MSFFKCHAGLIQSSLWTNENLVTKVVWITMLALADRNGEVMSSVPGIAKASGVSLDECVDALNRLQSPDPWSRTKTMEGRRIQEIDGGWEIINYRFYRELLSDKQKAESSAERSRRYRARKKMEGTDSETEPPF
jgi:hypothetical protein